MTMTLIWKNRKTIKPRVGPCFLNCIRIQIYSDPGRYFSRILPLSLSDCVEACMYLSSNISIKVDIGLSYSRRKSNTWSGECSAIRYNLTSSKCELIGPCNDYDYYF